MGPYNLTQMSPRRLTSRVPHAAHLTRLASTQPSSANSNSSKTTGTGISTRANHKRTKTRKIVSIWVWTRRSRCRLRSTPNQNWRRRRPLKTRNVDTTPAFITQGIGDIEPTVHSGGQPDVAPKSPAVAPPKESDLDEFGAWGYYYNEFSVFQSTQKSTVLMGSRFGCN